MIMLFFGEPKPRQTRAETDLAIVQYAARYFRERKIEAPKSLHVFHTEYGKPYLNYPGVYLGVTHTADLMLIAFGDTDFGIDAERIREIDTCAPISERFFTETEKAVLPSRGDGRYQSAFFELWCKKEAYIKFHGAGLSILKNTDTTQVIGSFHPILLPIGGYAAWIYAEGEIGELVLKTGNASQAPADSGKK